MDVIEETVSQLCCRLKEAEATILTLRSGLSAFKHMHTDFLHCIGKINERIGALELLPPCVPPGTNTGQGASGASSSGLIPPQFALEIGVGKIQVDGEGNAASLRHIMIGQMKTLAWMHFWWKVEWTIGKAEKKLFLSELACRECAFYAWLSFAQEA